MRLIPSLKKIEGPSEINKHHTQNEEMNSKWKIENNNGTFGVQKRHPTIVYVYKATQIANIDTNEQKYDCR